MLEKARTVKTGQFLCAVIATRLNSSQICPIGVKENRFAGVKCKAS